MKKNVSCLLFVLALTIVNVLGIVLGVADTQSATPMWDQYCSLCHGSAANFGSKTVDQITTAINTRPAMSGLKTLTSAQIQTIANELAPPPPPPPSVDTTPPTITSFNIPANSDSLTVPITTLVATDNVEVTGSMVTESSKSPSVNASGWSPSPPTSYTFATAGTKTLYAWAKDAAGNVSASLSATVDITITTPPLPLPPPDLTDWVGNWFRISEKATGYQSASSMMMKSSAAYTGYLKFWEWDPVNKVLKGDRYVQDVQSGQWLTEPFDLHYLAGSDLDFLCSSQVTGDLMMGFTARVQGKKNGEALEKATLKTLGGFYMETSSGANSSVSSAEYRAGGLSVTGVLVPEPSVPVPNNILIH